MTHQTIIQNVKKLLEDSPLCRNDDRNLIRAYMIMYHSNLWWFSSFSDAMDAMLLGKIPRFETICRHSRSLQREFGHLQGTNRKDRLKKQEKVKEDQGYIIRGKKIYKETNMKMELFE